MTSRRLSIAPAAGLLFLLGGCAETSPNGERAQFLEPPAMGRTLAQSGAPVASQTEASWPSGEWWRRFRSPELDRIVETALAENQSLKKAMEALRDAEAFSQVEGARLLPFLNADMGMRQSRIPNHGVVASYNPALAGLEKTMAYINPLSLHYEFDFWGKNRAILNAALGEAAAQAAETAEAQLLLTTAISRVYFRIRALARQAATASEMVKLRKDLLALAQTRFRTGIDTADGVTEASAAVEAAVKREAAVTAQLDFQQNLLARLMGQGPDAGRGVVGAKSMSPPAAPALPRQLPVELLAHRPDVAAAMHRAEAAAERIHAAKAEFMPSVDLTIVGGLEASRTSTAIDDLGKYLFRTSAIGYAVTPNIHLPLFQGGSLRGRLEGRRSEYDEAVDGYNETLLRAAQQVADSLARLKETRSETEAQRRLNAAARAELELARSRWSSGLKDKRELLAQAHAVLEQVYVLDALDADYLSSHVDLIQALGGGYLEGPEAFAPRPEPEKDRLTPLVDAIEALGGG
jgi:NodT family efflux transporter outer membrane factor (OMF) lipoprotein